MWRCCVAPDGSVGFMMSEKKKPRDEKPEVDNGGDERFDTLCSKAGSLGFEFVTFLGVTGDDEASHDMGYPFIAASCPPGWVDLYIKREYHKVDPALLLAPVAMGTMSWCDLDGAKLDFFRDASSHGLRTGLSIPVQLPLRCYLVNFATAREEPVSAPVRSELEGLAFMFVQDWLRACPQREPAPEFSEKTLKILRMSLLGFDCGSIATALGMTAHGIGWHLRNARRVLRCQTTMQACGRALFLGLIKV